MDVRMPLQDAMPHLVAWVGEQIDGGVGGNLVRFCIALALGDLLVDGHAELPDLRGS